MVEQNYSTDPAFALEEAIARKLSGLRARVDLFASTFSDQGKATQKAQIRVGWSGSDYKLIDKSLGALTSQETSRFEIEVEVVDLKTHASAMRYIRQATALLHGFKPFSAINPVEPVRSGDPRFNPEKRTWFYTLIVSASWLVTNGEYPPLVPVEELPADIDVILKIARFAPPNYEPVFVGELTED